MKRLVLPRNFVFSALAMSAISICGRAAVAEPATQPTTEESLISLNFPENVELKTFVDYVSQRLNINIIYQDEQLAAQKVTIKSPAKIPSSALMGLLENLLKIKGFALVDAEQAGFKRIVPLQSSAVPASQPAKVAGGGDRVVMQAFTLQFIDAKNAESAVKPFLSGPTAGSLGIGEQRLLLVTDFASNLKRIEQIIALIDAPNQNLRTVFIPVKNADAAAMALQVKQILTARAKAQALPGQNGEPNIEVLQDRRTGQLVVIGPIAQIDEAKSIIQSLDVPVTEQQSPVRFYKLANATATDVLETIKALEGESNEAKPNAINSQLSAVTPAAGPPGAGGSANGQGAGNGASGTVPTVGVNPSNSSSTGGVGLLQPGSNGSGGPGVPGQPLGGPGGNATGASIQKSVTPAVPTGLRTKNANLAADPNTNTIIVIAEPAVQKQYEQLIKALDKRRPQVLIEATIVSLDTSHGFQFGVELAGNSKPGNVQSVTFSSFGFSTPNPMTGSLALTPGVGFNGALIASDVADVIVRGLSTYSRAKITSAPRILVNDNATGTLTDLAEEPYTSTAIGTTISTTSFGGYAEAGTIVTVTPHISEADYLQLEYQVSLSSFTSAANSSQGIPPAIQQDSVQSKVTIPDGSTIIVGGLNRSNYSKMLSSVPFVDQIPIVKELFSSHNDSDDVTTIFVFLRPIILRDDQFEDLKFLSDRDLKEAELPPGMPTSEPIAIH